jgi:hypothetical protein
VAETKMNIYQKLMAVRVTLQKMNLKKTGANKFAGYDYYELSDFLPTAIQLMSEMGLCSLITFESEQARLEIIDMDNPDAKVAFTSPLAEAQLKGCHAIQNLGAVQTYSRRYLYMAALEIVESDVLDGTSGKEQKMNTPNVPKQNTPNTQKTNPDVISPEQLKKLYASAKGKSNAAKEIVAKFGYQSSKDILRKDFNAILDEIAKAEVDA